MMDTNRFHDAAWRLCLAAAALLVAAAAAHAAQPPKPTTASIASVYPAGGQKGTTVEVAVSGVNLIDSSAVRVTGDGVAGKVLRDKTDEEAKKAAEAKKKKKRKTSEDRDEETVYVSLTIAPDARPGQRELRLVTPGGVSNRYRFIVGRVPEVLEKEPNSKKDQAQVVASIPAVINGQTMSADVDIFRFKAKAGQTLVCEVMARRIQPFIPDAVPGWLQAALTLYDAGGKELMYADDFRFRPDPVLIYKVRKDGEYLLEIKDALYRGRNDFVYRLSVGAFPYITHLYPLGAPRKSTAKVELHGANLSKQDLSINLPDNCPPVRQVSLTSGEFQSNAVPFFAGDTPETGETEPNDSAAKANAVNAPVTINGRIQKPGDVDCFAFEAKAKQKLVIDVRARRLESPLDSIIAVLNSKGRELVQNDDTVDDGEQMTTHHADSHLVYTFPADGKYVVRIGDVQGKGGDEYAYRLSIAPPRPDFTLRVLPDNPRVGPGGTIAMTADAVRQGGFNGEIQITLKGLPKGFVVRGAAIPAKEKEVRFTITAPLGAAKGVLSPTVQGTARIADKVVVRKAVPAEEIQQAFSYVHRLPTEELLLSVVDPEPFTLTTDLAPDKVVEIKQGGKAQIALKVVRTDETKGQIRLAADKPPKGVTVRATPVPAGKNEATVTITAQKQTRVGFAQNIVVAGSLKVGKATIKAFAPAIPIKVIAATPAKALPKKAPPKSAAPKKTPAKTPPKTAAPKKTPTKTPPKSAPSTKTPPKKPTTTKAPPAKKVAPKSAPPPKAPQKK